MSKFVRAGAIALLASAVVGVAFASVDIARPTGPRLETGTDSKHDTSRPMRDILAEAGPTSPVTGVSTPRVNYFLTVEELTGSRSPEPPRDYVSKIQSFTTGVPAPDIGVAFNGLNGSESGGARPPDTTGDVSPTHYFEWVNSRWMLFDKVTGARLLASPANGNSFFVGFGGLCETTNRGDPLVLWDDAAQRWVVSQFAFVSSQAPGTFLQCMAVSTSSDPLGTYNRYQFTFPLFNDYGKMAVWRTQDGKQNAYTMTMHEFTAANPNVFQGTSFSAVERDKMLVGQPAKFIRVAGLNAFGGLPFHLEGNNPMPSSVCPQFIDRANSGNGYRLWNFCLDWNAGTTTFTDTPTIVATEQYFQDVAPAPQAGATVKLDAIGNHTMYMATMRAYEANGPAEATGVINHSVNVGNGRSGVSWVQLGYLPREVLLESPGSTVPGFGFESTSQTATRIIDKGIYAPGTDYRWMAGINQDKSGNIGLAYNATGYGSGATGASTINAQIRHSARARTDAPGVLRDENVGGFVGDCTPTATGAQTIAATATERWGDYSITSVDPSDDCTFWHAGEYYPVTSASNWGTRICSFKLAECGQPDFVLETTPGDQLKFCANPNVAPSVTLRIGALGAFAGNTALTAAGFPGGVTPTFGSTSLAPGASTGFALAGAAGITPGVYQGTINAVNGVVTRSRTVSFGVSSAAPAAPVQSAPANAAVGVSIRPILAWNSAPDAISYTIEVSTSATFATILETGTSSTNSFVPVTLLTSNTQYFWRVKQTNFCGVGATSAVASFTTGVPGVCPAGTTDNRVFFDDMSNDSIAWVAQHISGDATKLWVKGTPPAGTGITTRAWFNGNSDTNGVADQRLTSPSIVLPVAARRPITLSFDAHHQFETDGAANCWDGGLVEISTDNGATFTALGNSKTLTDVYPGTFSGGPAQGQFGWCRQAVAGTPVRSSFTLDQFAGQTVQLRFRASADDNTAGTAPAGWAIDNIEVKGCQ